MMLMMLLSAAPTVIAEEPQKTAEAAFGTPTVDGEPDSVWDNTPYNVIEKISGVDSDSYKGWFKILWDNEKMYVLARIYSKTLNDTDASPWNNDSFEVFIDEKYDHTEKYNADDYQLRSDFKGATSGTNYDFARLDAKGKTLENGYYVELAFPFVSETLKEGMTIGFDVQVNAAQTLASPKTVYRWSERNKAIYSNNSVMGSAILKRTVNVPEFNEPEFKGLAVAQYCTEREPDSFEMITDVKTTFDGKEFNYPVLHINEYPAMAIEDLADVIGGSTEGNALIKDNYRLTFTDGNRLAEDEKGHFLLERAPKLWTDGRLYVPVSFVKPYLTYNMHYNRFGKLLKITSGTNYPQEAQAVFYAKDFGAVGDGVHEDGKAITKALNAAMNSGVPSRVELEAGKTYLIGERVDSWSYFVIENVENLTFEGNGSTILFERATNTFMQIMSSKNVKIRNMDVDYKELCATQGRIVSVDKKNGKFKLEIDEGFPLPADDEWVHYYLTDGRAGGWWFGQLYDAKEDRMKYTNVDNLFVDKVEPVSGRVYDITIRGGEYGNARFAEVGDRFVLNTRFSAYDLKDSNARAGGSTSAIHTDHCTDVEFDGVYVYSTGWMFCGIGFSEGKTTFKNSGFKTKPGRLLCVNSDGIHTWFNRGSLILENCTFMNNLDDHFNTYNQGGFIKKIISKNTFETAADMNAEIGDEVQVYDQTNKKYLGRAFIKGYSKLEGNSRLVTLDRDFDGLTSLETTATPTLVYNMDSGSRGNSVRGCSFIYSRRYAILNRSANSLFEDNKVIGCGAGLAAMNELTSATKSEGGFPCTNTMRGNTITGDGNTVGNYPLEIRHWKSALGDSAPIDGFLLENNVIDVANSQGAMFINGVQDLYMINNKITNTRNATEKTMPVIITNCEISMLDGLDLNYSTDISAGVSIIGSKIDEENIKNIRFTQPNTGKAYTIE